MNRYFIMPRRRKMQSETTGLNAIFESAPKSSFAVEILGSKIHTKHSFVVVSSRLGLLG